jgi:hypothetical protein
LTKPPTPATSSPAPPALKARLLAAFDVTILWNKPANQATVRAVITDATLRALPAILNPGQDGYHDTAATPAGAGHAPAAVGHLPQPPITGSMGHSAGGDRTAAWLHASARRDAIAMPPDAVAETIAFAIAQPASVDIGEILVRPTIQP